MAAFGGMRINTNYSLFIATKYYKGSWLALLIFVVIGCSSQPRSLSSLQSNIRQQFTAAEGTFAMAFVNLADTSQKILINEREMFHAASTMKTPVMIEIFKQAKNGKFNLNDSLLIKNTFYSIVDSTMYRLNIEDDSYPKLYKQIGTRKSILDLMKAMITHSSNLATNILIEWVGADNITATMCSYGANDILVLRGVEDLKAFKRGLSNKTNAHDEMVIYSKIGRGKAVDKQASTGMIEILSQQQFNAMIPSGLPDSIKVAHKTGWITGVNHDCALIILPDKTKYVLILLSKEAPNRQKVHKMFLYKK